MVSSTSRFAASRRLALLVGVAALCLALPMAASAATTRYASPSGTGASPCVEAAPCSIETALSGAEGLANGDTVLLAPGTYNPAASLQVFNKVTISGEAGKPRPEIDSVGTWGLLLWEPATVRDLRVKSPITTSSGIASISPVTLEQVESIGEAAGACATVGVIRDSLCVSTPVGGGGDGVVIFESGSTPNSSAVELFNVTAIGGDAGLLAGANQKSTVTLKATNTIASGEEADVAAESFVTTAPVNIILSHSNFESFRLEGTSLSVTPPTENGNQTAAPLFVNAAAGEYAEQEGSPTRLAGDLGDVVPGELDLLGQPRTTNCAGTIGVDIGAYQFECPEPPPSNPPSGEDKKQDTGTNPPPPPPPATRPSLAKLALKPPKFKVTGKSPSGTKITFTLSDAATVKLEVLGKKAVKGHKPKTVVLGALPPVPGKAGANSVKFSGKLKGKPLEAGKYTLRATATAGAFSSSPLSASFEVLIP